jgi:hypothetical protein
MTIIPDILEILDIKYLRNHISSLTSIENVFEYHIMVVS